jgi:hypothetical protein
MAVNSVIHLSIPVASRRNLNERPIIASTKNLNEIHCDDLVVLALGGDPCRGVWGAASAPTLILVVVPEL